MEDRKIDVRHRFFRHKQSLVFAVLLLSVGFRDVDVESLQVFRTLVMAREMSKMEKEQKEYKFNVKLNGWNTVLLQRLAVVLRSYFSPSVCRLSMGLSGSRLPVIRLSWELLAHASVILTATKERSNPLTFLSPVQGGKGIVNRRMSQRNDVYFRNISGVSDISFMSHGTGAHGATHILTHLNRWKRKRNCIHCRGINRKNSSFTTNKLWDANCWYTYMLKLQATGGRVLGTQHSIDILRSKYFNFN